MPQKLAEYKRWTISILLDRLAGEARWISVQSLSLLQIGRPTSFFRLLARPKLDAKSCDHHIEYFWKWKGIKKVLCANDTPHLDQVTFQNFLFFYIYQRAELLLGINATIMYAHPKSYLTSFCPSIPPDSNANVGMNSIPILCPNSLLSCSSLEINGNSY